MYCVVLQNAVPKSGQDFVSRRRRVLLREPLDEALDCLLSIQVRLQVLLVVVGRWFSPGEVGAWLLRRRRLLLRGLPIHSLLPLLPLVSLLPLMPLRPLHIEANGLLSES